MSRNYGTTRSGFRFSEAIKLAVWQAAKAAPNQNPAYTRQDACGALIDWDKYGITTTNGRGWEIDHIVPVAKGGLDILPNLQALQWENNRYKSDNVSTNYCVVSVAR